MPNFYFIFLVQYKKISSSLLAWMLRKQMNNAQRIRGVRERERGLDNGRRDGLILSPSGVSVSQLKATPDPKKRGSRLEEREIER